MQRKLRTIIASSMLAALMALGSAPAAHADGKLTQDNDVATAIGGNGGNGGIAVGVGVCLINVSVLAAAGCANNGVGDASGGNGGSAIAIADEN